MPSFTAILWLSPRRGTLLFFKIRYTRSGEKLGCVDTFSLKNSEVVKSNRQTQFYYSLCLVPC